MKIELFTSYTSKNIRLAELNRQIEDVEKILKTPERTVEDVVRHIQLMKEKLALTS